MINSIASYLFGKVPPEGADDSGRPCQPGSADLHHHCTSPDCNCHGQASADKKKSEDPSGAQCGSNEWIFVDLAGVESSSGTITDSVVESAQYDPLTTYSADYPVADGMSDSSDVDASEEPNDFARFRGPYVNMVDLEQLNDATLSDASSQPELVFNPSREECWLVTPSPCFTVDPGEVCHPVTTGSMENLLIEHPSMSVYQMRGRRPIHGSVVVGSRTLRAPMPAEFSSRESLLLTDGLTYNFSSNVDDGSPRSRVSGGLESANSLQPWLADSESSSLNNSFTTDGSLNPPTSAGATDGNADDIRRLVPALAASPRRKNKKCAQKGHGNLSRAALDRRNKVFCDNQAQKIKYHHKNHSSSGSSSGQSF